MLKLKNLLIENSGPIESLNIKFELNNNEEPKPIIIVGENGSGKTTTLSFIVDSLLQIASTKFSDVLTSEGMGTLYYRIRSHDIHLGTSNSLTHICYDFDGRDIHYLDRVGDGSVDADALRQRLNLPQDFPINVAQNAEKVVSQNLEGIDGKLRTGAYVFFPGGRKEVPHWLQKQALNSDRYRNNQTFNTRLDKSLIVESAAEDTVTWIMDGLLDQSLGYPSAGIAVANQILQIILQDPTAHFAIAPRNIWPRVQIFTGTGPSDADNPNPRRMLIPSLAHLSAGQAMLLSMFATIVNHGTLNQNRPLQDIEGIVIVDEAELYLHTHLQRLVLPSLIKLFPKVQFVMSTHSPSFLVGMNDKFGSDGFKILSLPSGEAINVDQFREIGAAIEALGDTAAFRNQVKIAVALENELPILIVEGKSDSIWIDGLWRTTMKSPPPFRILAAKGRRALRYLLEDEQFIDEVGNEQIVLGLFDFDEAYDDWNGCQKLYPNREGSDVSGLLRKHALKKIYAGLLPVPSARSKQAGERFKANSQHTIEMYIPDDQLLQTANLEKISFPGDVEVSKFTGDKVAFAENLSTQLNVQAYFEPLLTLISTTFGISKTSQAES